MHHVGCMRDDLHNFAPVSPEWRKVLRFCLREADPVSQIGSAISNAVRAELREQVSENFLRYVVRMFMHESVTGSLFPTTTRLGPHTQLEFEIEHYTRQKISEGYTARGALHEAFCACIADQIESNRRALTQFVSNEAASHLRRSNLRFAHGLETINIESIASSLANVAFPRNAPKQEIDVDESLGGPNAS